MTTGASSERPRAVPRAPSTDPAQLARRGGIPDDGWLIRCGESRALTLAEKSLDCYDDFGFYGLSFWTFPSLSPEEIALRVRADCEAAGIRNLVPQPVLRPVRPVELLSVHEAFHLRRTGPRPGHYTLYLPMAEGCQTWTSRGQLLASDYGDLFHEIYATLGPTRDNPARETKGVKP